MSLKLLSIIISIFMLATVLTGCAQNGIHESGTTPPLHNGDNSDNSNDFGSESNESIGNSNGESNENTDNESKENEDTSNENTDSSDNVSDENTDNSDNDSSKSDEDLNTENNGSSDDDAENLKKPEEDIPLGNTVGYKFRDLSLQTVDGSYISTADLRGKIIILNVWAIWCSPCIMELPDFNEVAAEYKDDVIIIAAHLYDEYQVYVPGYVASNFPDTDIVFAYDNAYESAYYAAGGVGYVPQTAIIDRDGIIRYANSGGLSHAALVSLIDNIL